MITKNVSVPESATLQSNPTGTGRTYSNRNKDSATLNEGTLEKVYFFSILKMTIKKTLIWNFSY